MFPSKLSSLSHPEVESKVISVDDFAAAAAVASMEMNANTKHQRTATATAPTTSTICSSSSTATAMTTAEKDGVGSSSSSCCYHRRDTVLFPFRRRRNFRQTASALELQLEQELIQERIRWCRQWQIQHQRDPIQKRRQQRKNLIRDAKMKEKEEKHIDSKEQRYQWRLYEQKIRCEHQKRLWQHFYQQQQKISS